MKDSRDVAQSGSPAKGGRTTRYIRHLKNTQLFEVYILYSDFKRKYYTGQSKDPLRRLVQHNNNEVSWTKNGGPWRLIYRKQFLTRKEAIIFERRIKKRGARRFLKDNDLI